MRIKHAVRYHDVGVISSRPKRHVSYTRHDLSAKQQFRVLLQRAVLGRYHPFQQLETTNASLVSNVAMDHSVFVIQNNNSNDITACAS